MKEDWSPTRAMKNLIQSSLCIYGLYQQNTSTHSLVTQDSISEKTIEKAVFQAAKLVNNLGPQYVDVFERLEKELIEARNTLATIDRIQVIATSPSYATMKSYSVQPAPFLLQAWTKAIARS